MIWHLFEVWLMVVLTFVVGCLAGAHLYGLLAGSRLAIAQGIVADAIGDVVDRIKARIGLAPAWRPAHLRHVERPVAVAHRADNVTVQPELEPEPEPFEEEWLPAADHADLATEITAVRIDRKPARNRPGKPPDAPAERPKVAAIAPRITPMRPAGVVGPRGGVPDNLQRIKGIGKRNEELLNRLGIYHFGQVAAWTPAEVLWIGQYLAFPERIVRDDWVGQAILLAMGGETGFQKSAERRRERRRREREFQSRMTTASNAYDSDDGEGGDDREDDDMPDRDAAGDPNLSPAEASPTGDDGDRDETEGGLSEDDVPEEAR